VRPTPDDDRRHDGAPPRSEPALEVTGAASSTELGRRARLLRQRIAALPIAIADACCVRGDVVVPSYPDGPRPSSTVVLSGAGSRGRGEHVGWTRAAHEDFARRVAGVAFGRCSTVADVARLVAGTVDDPYDRAALEAAAIDLALVQAGTNPFRLTDIATRPLRYVLSFERVADPLGRAARELRVAPGLELKLDVDPCWDDATLAELAALDRVRVLDFKLAGSVADHERAHRLVATALLEDPLPAATPWSASLRARLSLDASIRSAASVAELDERALPAAVNVKPARIGGMLEALDVVAACAARGIAVYFGGMFEVGVGRAQVQALAALLCPDAPNDVAPIAVGDAPARRPPRLVVPDDGIGFTGHAAAALALPSS
jgi:L-alanine-DL-glutamate epimerase-like enolase superfamily enzyme